MVAICAVFTGSCNQGCFMFMRVYLSVLLITGTRERGGKRVDLRRGLQQLNGIYTFLSDFHQSMKELQ